jgi:hypothetical protein
VMVPAHPCEVATTIVGRTVIEMRHRKGSASPAYDASARIVRAASSNRARLIASGCRCIEHKALLGDFRNIPQRYPALARRHSIMPRRLRQSQPQRRKF